MAGPFFTVLVMTRHYAINLIEDADSRLLLLKRAAHLELGPGLWGFCAGKLEPGEDAAACSLREITEEIGDARQLRLLRALPPRGDSFYGGTMTLHLFHYRWLGGEISLNGEHSDWAWVRAGQYRHFAVMDGMDEDIALLGIWPQHYLDPDRLPPGNGV